VGEVVTITGSGFTGVTSATFNGLEGTNLTVVSDSQIQVTVPSSGTTGLIEVVNVAGTDQSSQAFTVLVEPEISGFSPTSGPVGEVVTITGSGFAGVTSVTFNGLEGTNLTVVSDSEIQVRAPSGVTTGLIEVINPVGADLTAENFVVLIGPLISSFAPTTGLAGDVITLTGSGFTGVTSVTFNGLEGTNLTIVSDSELQITVPQNSTSGLIRAINAGGTGISLESFTVLVAPQISGFTPASGSVGEVVTITGSGFTGVMSATFNGLEGINLTVISDTEISVVVPPSVTTGPIELSNRAGSDLSSGNFTVLVVPQIIGFNPTSGPAGEIVTIAGVGFTGVSEVTFNGIAGTNLTVVSDTELQITVPPGSSTGLVNVVNAAGSDLSSGNFTVLVAPQISSFSPTTGLIGEIVTIAGSGFTGVSNVSLNGLAGTNLNVVSDSQIQVTVPANATTGLINVINPAGSDLSTENFIVLVEPQVSGLSPTDGLPGDVVTITGNGFTGVSNVTFNGLSGTNLTIVSDNEIQVTVPAGVTNGLIGVINPAGSDLSSESFIRLVQPQISGFSPTSSPAGDVVTLTGSGFTGVTSVTFNGVTGTGLTVVSDNEIQVTVPANGTTGLIGVTNRAGSGLSSQSFTVLVDPEISGFSPIYGLPGDLVTLTGNGFTGVDRVTFNGVTGTNLTIVSDNEIRVTVPPSVTTGRVRVINPAGADISVESFTRLVTPQVTGFNPTSAPAGEDITIMGNGFTGAISVTFNGVAREFLTVISDNEIEVTVPPDVATGPVSVFNRVGSGVSDDDFIVVVEPEITGFSPAIGLPGDVVTITGNGFLGVTLVRFNGIAGRNLTVVSDTEIRITVPPAGSTGVIKVNNPAGNDTSSTDFIVLVEPDIDRFTPINGLIGEDITIIGSGFTGATQVKFNGIVGDNLAVLSDNEIRVTVPIGSETGRIRVLNPAGADQSSQNFAVLVEPHIHDFTPTTVPAGDIITITGVGLTGVDRVTFNGVEAEALTVVSDSEIQVTLPPEATTGLIRVMNRAGTDISGEDLVVLIDPEIGSFEPTYGLPGDLVTVTGTGFTGITIVRFNRIKGTDLAVLSDSELQVRVPTGATDGVVKVVNPAGVDLSSENFIIIVPPQINEFGPERGLIGERVIISGSGFIGVTDLIFNGTPALTFTRVSSTYLQTLVPAGATTGPIKVINPAGHTVTVDEFGVILPPEITGFTPIKGIVGEEVIIFGQHLSPTLQISFDGVIATEFSVISDTQVSAIVPEGGTTGSIQITTPIGSVLSGDSFIIGDSVYLPIILH
ncbi:MAG: IPT/TIG domain-containing protein, partial [Chloroflexota bacterium]